MKFYRMWWEEFVRQTLLSIPYMEQYWPDCWEEMKGKEQEEEDHETNSQTVL